MAQLTSLGGLLGSYQQQSSALQNALAQQQGPWYNATTTATTTAGVTLYPNQFNQSYTFTVNDFGSITPTAAKPREKTNLDWLNERVNEMRVGL